MSAKPVGGGESQLYQHPAEEHFVKMDQPVQRPWGRRRTSEADREQRALCYRSKICKENKNAHTVQWFSSAESLEHEMRLSESSRCLQSSGEDTQNKNRSLHCW